MIEKEIEVKQLLEKVMPFTKWDEEVFLHELNLSLSENKDYVLYYKNVKVIVKLDKIKKFFEEKNVDDRLASVESIISEPVLEELNKPEEEQADEQTKEMLGKTRRRGERGANRI